MARGGLGVIVTVGAFHLPRRRLINLSAIMASGDVDTYDSNSESTLSDALGTETLDARSMVHQLVR